jgi:hypothetical protein
MKFSPEAKILIASALIVLAFMAFGLIQPYFEARAFNRLTGGTATYWDAVWVDLRVMGSEHQ